MCLSSFIFYMYLDLCADDLVLCSESDEDLRAIVRRFVELCRRKGLKVNAGKSKVMVLSGERELVCEIYIDRVCFEHVSDFKYLGCECSRKVGRRVAGIIMSLVNARDLQLECA